MDFNGKSSAKAQRATRENKNAPEAVASI